MYMISKAYCEYPRNGLGYHVETLGTKRDFVLSKRHYMHITSAATAIQGMFKTKCIRWNLTQKLRCIDVNKTKLWE
jgi:hypothetical protein